MFGQAEFGYDSWWLCFRSKLNLCNEGAQVKREQNNLITTSIKVQSKVSDTLCINKKLLWYVSDVDKETFRSGISNSNPREGQNLNKFLKVALWSRKDSITVCGSHWMQFYQWTHVFDHKMQVSRNSKGYKIKSPSQLQQHYLNMGSKLATTYQNKTEGSFLR